METQSTVLIILRMVPRVNHIVTFLATQTGGDMSKTHNIHRGSHTKELTPQPTSNSQHFTTQAKPLGSCALYNQQKFLGVNYLDFKCRQYQLFSVKTKHKEQN